MIAFGGKRERGAWKKTLRKPLLDESGPLEE
jgi:hypothetical protein